MHNPIQHVLAAEKEANRAILEARAEAESAVAEARREAKRLLAHNEQRLKQVCARFERAAQRDREARAAAMRRAAAEHGQATHAEIDRRLAALVQAVFEESWPSPAGQRNQRS